MRSTAAARHLSIAALSLALAASLLASPARAAGTPAEVMAVTASSTDGMLMDAIDDDAQTAWQNKPGGERSAWLALHFAHAVKLRAASLQTGPLAPGVSFDLEASTDGDLYRPVLKNQRIGRDGPVEFAFARPIEALYLRVTFHYTGAGSAPRFRIAELKALQAN